MLLLGAAAGVALGLALASLAPGLRLPGLRAPARPAAVPLAAVHPSPPGAPAVPAPFRVLTYNMRHGARDDGTVDLGAVARVIRESGADVVALQEVDAQQFRSGLVDQGRRLAAELGMELVFAPTMRRGVGRYGNALLSRFPVREPRSIALPAALEPRGALVARVEVPGGGVWVAVTHLGLSAGDRAAQAAALAQALAGLPDPVVLLGDWNTQAGAPELAALRDRFRAARAGAAPPPAPAAAPAPGAAPAPPAEAPTLRGRDGEGVAAIDHVFLSDGVALLETAVLPDRVSDHQPVTALLVLPRRG